MEAELFNKKVEAKLGILFLSAIYRFTWAAVDRGKWYTGGLQNLRYKHDRSANLTYLIH